MFYAALSYTIHHAVPEDTTALVRELQGRYDVFSYVPGTHFHASFGHLEGYTSAYYTYMWSLVIAKDLFSAFDEDDLFAPEVAHRYRDRVLAAGGPGRRGPRRGLPRPPVHVRGVRALAEPGLTAAGRPCPVRDGARRHGRPGRISRTRPAARAAGRSPRPR